MKTLLKKSTAVIKFMLALIIAFALFGCAGGMGSTIVDGSIPAGDHSDSGVTESPDVSEDPSDPQKPYAKQLTAAEWRDALDYERWLGLFERDTDGELIGEHSRAGIFADYAKATRGLNTFNMHEVHVSCGDNPVVGATVKLYDAVDVVYTAVTDSAGKAYVFGDGVRIEATSGEYTVSADVSDGMTDIELTDSAVLDNELEIMLVVDTTGSMGDELSFLCNELAGVVTRVAAAIDCDIRLGLIFYRDEGDKYVTRKFDFTDVTSPDGLNAVVKNIRAQNSEGGGDYPEAVDAALKEAVDAEWHADSKTKLLFQVLDAPYHDEQENQSRFSAAVASAAQKGIRIIPVAASGLNTLGQYTMRSAALLTGGTYTFLTDDSGIGDSHEIPDVGEYTTEYLSDLMVRLIKGYYTGTFDNPVPWTQSDRSMI